MSFHYPTVNYQIPLHFRLKRGEPSLKNRVIQPVILIEDLRELGIPWQIAKFIYNANFSKNIYFKINGELIGPRVNLVGLPEGCILSPIMYAVYTRRLQSFVPNNCVIEFADDIALLCRSATPEICRNALQRCLSSIGEDLRFVQRKLGCSSFRVGMRIPVI